MSRKIRVRADRRPATLNHQGAIWVKATGHETWFSQLVRDPKGKVVGEERVYAPKRVPTPMAITYTEEAEATLAAGNIVECSWLEIAAHCGMIWVEAHPRWSGPVLSQRITDASGIRDERVEGFVIRPNEPVLVTDTPAVAEASKGSWPRLLRCSEEDVTAWLTDHPVPEILRPVPKVWRRPEGDAPKMWVKAAHPLASFAQDVRDGLGRVVDHEHVYAPTVLDPSSPNYGQQVPIPMLVTVTPTVERALRERPLGARRDVTTIVRCSEDEVAAWLTGEAPDVEGGGLGHREGFLGRSTKGRQGRSSPFDAF